MLGRALDKAWLVVSEDKWGKGSVLASARVLWELSGEASGEALGVPLEAVLGKALVVELAAALVEVSVELGRWEPVRGKGKRGASRGLRPQRCNKRTRGNLSHARGMLREGARKDGD